MKKLLTILLLFISVVVSAQTTGIHIATPIIKNNPTDNTITGYANLLNSGYHIVANYHGRDSLVTAYSTVLATGLLVYEVNVDSTYRWNGSGWNAVNITLGTLTFGTHLTGGSYNGSLPVTLGTDATPNPTASTILSRDANSNAWINNIVQNLTTTNVTISGTTTLTVSSAPFQNFTGGGAGVTETVILPVTSTLTTGTTFNIANNPTSSLVVNVESSGGNLIASLGINTSGTFVCVSTSGTGVASWFFTENVEGSLLSSNNIWSGINTFTMSTILSGEFRTNVNSDGTACSSDYGRALSNMYTGAGGEFVAFNPCAPFALFAGGAATEGHVILSGQASSSNVTSGNVGGNLILPGISISWVSSASDIPIIANILSRPPIITGSGTAHLVNAANAYFQGAPTATVTGANYVVWALNGLSRIDSLQIKNLYLNGAYGTANQVPMMNGAGTAMVWGTASGTGTVTSVSASNSQGVTTTVTNATTTPNIAIGLGNITPTTISTTIKPATIYQTATGTAGTDSVMVKHSGGIVDAISATYYAPTASPTFTGTVTIPTPFTLGATSVTSTGTQLNYLSSATGTTGVTTSNVVFSNGPTFTGTTSGSIFSASNGIMSSATSANLYMPSNANSSNTASFTILGGTGIWTRAVLGAGTSQSAGSSGFDYVNTLIAPSIATSANSSTTPNAVNFFVKTLGTFTLGTSASLTNSYTAYIDAASSAATNNYTLGLGIGRIKIVEGSNSIEGQTTLVSGTKAISIAGIGTGSRAHITLVSQSGTVTTTVQYEGVCTSGTLTINAVTNAGTNTVNTGDTSTVNYIVYN